MYAPTPPAFSPPGASPAPFGYGTPRASSRFLEPSPAASNLPLPTSTRARSVTGTSLAGTGTARSSNAVPAGLQDQVLEAKRVVALLVGLEADGGKGGLLAEIENAWEAVWKRCEGTFEEGQPVPDIQALLAQLQTLLNLLRSSPVGGFPVSTPSAPIPGIDVHPSVVQKLFRDRQRAREAAEIAGSVLSSTV